MVQQTTHLSDKLSVEYMDTVHIFDMDGTIIDSLVAWEKPILRWWRVNPNHRIIRDLNKCFDEAGIEPAFIIQNCSNYVEQSIRDMKSLVMTYLGRRAHKTGVADYEYVVQLLNKSLAELEVEVFNLLAESYKNMTINKHALEYISYCKNTLGHKVVLATLNNKQNLDIVIDRHPTVFTLDGGLFDMVVYRQMFETQDVMYDKIDMVEYIIETLKTDHSLVIMYDDTEIILDTLSAEIGKVKISNIDTDWQHLLRIMPPKFTKISDTQQRIGYTQKFVHVLTDPTPDLGKPTLISDKFVLSRYSGFPEVEVVYGDLTKVTLT